MIKGAEHVLKSTEWKKKQRRKTGHQASAQTKVWGYVCPANREQIVTYYIGLSLLASVMSWPFQETDASNPINIKNQN